MDELTLTEFVANLGLFGVLFVIAGVFLVRYFFKAIAKIARGAEVREVKSDIHAIRALARVLPAIGLLGTLAGMNLAFRRANFGGEDVELATEMSNLMQNFALALFTTIVGVVGKICADLFCHFAVEQPLLARTTPDAGASAGKADAKPERAEPGRTNDDGTESHGG